MSDSYFNNGSPPGGSPHERVNDGFSAGEGLDLPPWERRDRFGFLNGLYLTIKDVLFTPYRFFQKMPSAVGLGQPLLFAIVVGTAGAFAAWMWALTGSSLELLLQDKIADAFRGPLYSFLMFVFSPLLVSAHVFIQAGLIHLVLMLVDGNRLGYEATFRVSAYAAATDLLVIVPLCGQLLLLIWSLVVMVIGIHSIHQTEPWKAVVAVLVPTLCCLAAFGGLFTIMAWRMF